MKQKTSTSDIAVTQQQQAGFVPTSHMSSNTKFDTHAHGFDVLHNVSNRRKNSLLFSSSTGTHEISDALVTQLEQNFESLHHESEVEDIITNQQTTDSLSTTNTFHGPVLVPKYTDNNIRINAPKSLVMSRQVSYSENEIEHEEQLVVSRIESHHNNNNNFNKNVHDVYVENFRIVKLAKSIVPCNIMHEENKTNEGKILDEKDIAKYLKSGKLDVEAIKFGNTSSKMNLF
jgi:hypothetical protein